MKIFEICFVEINGERSYRETRYVIAKDLEDASEHAEKKLNAYFGEGETLVFDGWVEDDTGYYVAKLDGVREVDEIMAYTASGDYTKIDLTISQEPQCKSFIFDVRLRGIGDGAGEAWDDAVSNFCEDPGMPDSVEEEK
jgi:hypothetical protein